MADQLILDVRMPITAGPSKGDCMLALFEGDGNSRHHVIFTFERQPAGNAPNVPALFQKSKSGQVAVAIETFGREDNSGENWIFEGSSKSGEYCFVRGYYSTHKRTGWIEFKRPT